MSDNSVCTLAVCRLAGRSMSHFGALDFVEIILDMRQRRARLAKIPNFLLFGARAFHASAICAFAFRLFIVGHKNILSRYAY